MHNACGNCKGWYRVSHHLLAVLLEKIVHFTSTRVREIHFVTRVGKHYLMLTCIRLGCVCINLQKCPLGELEHNMKRMNRRTDTSIEEYDWLFAGKQCCPIWIFFPKNISAEVSQSPYTLSSVTLLRVQKKFSSTFSVSPTNSVEGEVSTPSCN